MGDAPEVALYRKSDERVDLGCRFVSGSWYIPILRKLFRELLPDWRRTCIFQVGLPALVVILVKADFNFIMGFFENWTPRTARSCLCQLAQGNSFNKKGPRREKPHLSWNGRHTGEERPPGPTEICSVKWWQQLRRFSLGAGHEILQFDRRQANCVSSSHRPLDIHVHSLRKIQTL